MILWNLKYCQIYLKVLSVGNISLKTRWADVIHSDNRLNNTKKTCLRDNLKNNNWITPIFMWSYPWLWTWPDQMLSLPPIIKMAASWRLISFGLFLLEFTIVSWNLVYIGFWGLWVYCHWPFSCATKKGYGGHLDFINLINRYYFQLNALKPGIFFRCTRSTSLLALSFFM